MTSPRDEPQSYENLRLRAEQCREARGGSFNSVPASAEDAQRLLHELEVHQIELEMQNLALQQVRDVAEDARATYQDLYDFAPVGYFTLSPKGIVLRANLTGASLLGIERGILCGCPFANQVGPKQRGTFGKFMQRVFKGEGPVSTEIQMLRRGGEAFFASLEARKEGEGPDVRMVMTDVSRRKEEEKSARLLKSTTKSNQKLRAEISHREEVEATLEAAREKLNQSLEQSENQREQLQNLSHALLHAQEEERKRISRELHDGVVQALVAIQYQFELLAQKPETDSVRLQAQVTQAQSLLEGATDLVHRFAFDLRPSALDHLGLGPTLETFVARFTEMSGIPVTLNLFEGLDRIGAPERTMLFRVAQSAFNNVSRHAGAGTVHLSIQELEHGIRMEITDDGVGMDPDPPESAYQKGHLGLIGMKERVEMIGGHFQILSRRGEYTTVRVDLPVWEDLSDKDGT